MNLYGSLGWFSMTQEQFMAHNRFALTDNSQRPKESVLAEVACFMYAVAKNMFLTSFFFFYHFAAV